MPKKNPVSPQGINQKDIQIRSVLIPQHYELQPPTTDCTATNDGNKSSKLVLKSEA